MPYQSAWLIFLLPLFSFIIISLFVRPFVRKESKVAGYITIAAIGGSLALSIWALIAVMSASHHELPMPPVDWVIIENGVIIQLGIIMDSLTAVMLVVVTVVSLMVQIYSQGYMEGDPGYHRYYAFMSLFTMSMLGLVLANNLLFMFVFWEMVGLCSYLLIGFWFHKPSAADAAKKAFIVTRIGDFGFLAGILILFVNTGTFDTAELHGLAIAGALAGSTLTWAAIGIFAGAVGKSAQFPLHVWLPDALPGRWASQHSSRCTSGCRMPWRVPPRSAPSSIRQRWCRRGSSWWHAPSPSLHIPRKPWQRWLSSAVLPLSLPPPWAW